VKGDGVAASLGAQYAAKFLPTETYTQKLALKIGPEKAIKLGFSVLTKLGRLEAEENQSPYPLLKAVVGSGFLNMNPTIVWLEILAADSTGCEVTVTAGAKRRTDQAAHGGEGRATSCGCAQGNGVWGLKEAFVKASEIALAVV
jgi:hypothetical protein